MMIFKVGSGPLWFSYIAGSINCDKYWWTSLLYIQNYYNPDSIVSILTPFLHLNLIQIPIFPLCFLVSATHMVFVSRHAIIRIRTFGQLFTLPFWIHCIRDSWHFHFRLCWLDLLALCAL